MMYRLVAINLDRIADPGNYRTMLPAASLRSLRLRGKDSWLWVFMEKSNYRDRLNITVAYASGSEGSVLIPC